MPKLLQGDVFEVLEQSKEELAVIFGHIGFNHMRERWEVFARHVHVFGDAEDPFTQFPREAQRAGDGKWLWFVPDAENHGMSDEQLTHELDEAFQWALERGIRLIITTGVANTDHGHDAELNRQSDDERAQFLVAYAQAAEQRHGLVIRLVSLNDVFLRNR